MSDDRSVTDSDPQASSRKDTDEKVSSKQFTKDQFDWLEHVVADPSLTSAAFKVAFVISRHINRGSGEAWPSKETIAAKAALWPSQVVEAVKELVVAGYLGMKPGRRGRGHSNRYWMLKPWLLENASQPALAKGQQADVSQLENAASPKTAKRSKVGPVKGQPAETKGQPVDLNPMKNTLSNTQDRERAYGPRSARIERVAVTVSLLPEKARAFGAPLHDPEFISF